MRDKFFRAQQFVYRHRGTFGYIAGVSVMTAVVVSAKRKPYTLTVTFPQTAEQVAKMLVDDGALEFVNQAGSKIRLVPGVAL